MITAVKPAYASDLSYFYPLIKAKCQEVATFFGDPVSDDIRQESFKRVVAQLSIATHSYSIMRSSGKGFLRSITGLNQKKEKSKFLLSLMKLNSPDESIRGDYEKSIADAINHCLERPAGGHPVGLSRFSANRNAVPFESRRDQDSSLESQIISPPKISVAELFSNAFVDSGNFEPEGAGRSWKVAGQGLGELAIWTRETANGERTGALRAEQEKKRDHQTILDSVSSHPILLNKDTRPLFERMDDPDIEFDGTIIAYEYIFDPVALSVAGTPINFYLVKKAPGDPSEVGFTSKLLASEDYYSKALQLANEGHDNLAQEYYRKAAVLGHPEAAFQLAQKYLSDKNTALAQEWLEKAAKNGHKESGAALADPEYNRFIFLLDIVNKSAEIEFELAEIFKYGKCWLTRNDDVAIKWYQKAAHQGNAEAQFELGNFYARSNDQEKMLKWYQKAAENGYKAATDLWNQEENALQMD
ncbi:MAG: tetratricopeptide repeat protein [Bdellovibrionia bacterium]